MGEPLFLYVNRGFYRVTTLLVSPEWGADTGTARSAQKERFEKRGKRKKERERREKKGKEGERKVPSLLRNIFID